MSSTPSSRDASPKAASRPISDGAPDIPSKAGQQQFLVALGGLLSLAAAIGIGRFVYTPILPYMVESLGLSNAQGGLLASANFLGYLAGAVAASSSLLRSGPRSWLLSGLALSALTTVAMGVTSTVAWWVLLRFAGGVASAFVLVFASALVLDRLAAAKRADLAGLHFAGVGAGIAVSAVVVSSLAALGQDWRMLWIASGFLALLALAAVAGLIADEQQPRSAAPEPSLKRTRPDGKLVALAVAYGLFGFGYVIAATFISTLVRVSPDARVLEPVVWLAVGLAAVPSVPLWARWGRKIGNARAMAAACLIEAVGVSLLVLSTSRAGVIVSAVLLGGTIMGITALGLMHARNLSRGDPRATLALLTAAFGLGQIIGPTLAGVLADAMGTFAPAMLISVAALLIGALFSLRAETRSWT